MIKILEGGTLQETEVNWNLEFSYPNKDTNLDTCSHRVENVKAQRMIVSGLVRLIRVTAHGRVGWSFGARDALHGEGNGMRRC